MSKTLQHKNFKEGVVLLINKRKTYSSFSVVRKIRNAIRRNTGISKIKVGHAGTLDPLAEGLLIICTGKATKQIQDIQIGEKEYIAEVMLGATTPSYDLETDTDQVFPIDHITTDMIEHCLGQFVGEIKQIPPIYSALKVGGERAYKKARRGDNIEMSPRIVTINKIELLENNFPILKLKIECSKGTYIRSLANDIGKHLNSGGYLKSLIRTKIGDYSIENAITVDEFEERLLEL